MPYYAREDEIDGIIEHFGLPELPEPSPDEDDPELRKLVLFRQSLDGDNIVLAEGIGLADAQEYCSREDTSGDGWFIGFDR